MRAASLRLDSKICNGKEYITLVSNDGNSSSSSSGENKTSIIIIVVQGVITEGGGVHKNETGNKALTAAM